jgi:acyl carrier protein
MTTEQIKANLTEIFKDVFDDNSIVLTRETTAADIEDWDSLAQITLLVAIEKEFKINLSLDEVKLLRNVGDMLDIIQRKVPEL